MIIEITKKGIAAVFLGIFPVANILNGCRKAGMKQISLSFFTGLVLYYIVEMWMILILYFN